MKGLRLKKQYINGKRENFHSNFPVRLKKSLWESRTTATLAAVGIFNSFSLSIVGGLNAALAVKPKLAAADQQPVWARAGASEHGWFPRSGYFWNVIWTQKGQFKPAGVRKLFEKHFT
jgi:hypothetical protein